MFLYTCTLYFILAYRGMVVFI